MSYVKSVASNLKGIGAPEPIALGPLTYIWGENGSAKTALVQSIELALTGSVADIGGQPEARREPSYLMRLAPGRSGSLWAEAVLSTGEQYRTVIKGSSASAQKPSYNSLTRLDYDAVFPARWMAETLVRSVATIRKAVLDAVGRSVTRERLQQLLPDMEIPETSGIALHGAPAFTPIQALIAMRADFERQKKQARDEANKIEAAVVERPSAPTFTADIAKLEKDVAEAEIAFAQADSTAGQIGADPAATLLKAMMVVYEAVTVNLEHAPHACLVCKSSTAKGGLVTRQEEVRKAITTQKQAQTEWVTRADAAVDARQRAASALDHARSALSTARSLMSSQRAAQTQAVTVDRNRLLDLRQQADRLDRRIQDIDAAVERVLADGAETFRQKVQAAYGTDAEVGLLLRDGSREVFELGLLRGGTLHTALSGAEWARLAAATAAAVDSTSPVRILVPADRAMTPKTMALVQEALAGAVQRGMIDQVILQNVIPPPVVDGWTVVAL